MAEHYSVGVVCIRGVGPERGGRNHNEDNYLVCNAGRARFRSTDGEVDRETAGHGLLVAVADGMGGHDHGDVASGAAVQALLRLYAKGAQAANENALLSFVHKAHGRLQERARERGAANMGTTLTCLWIHEGQASWVHVGDSRLYLCRGDLLTQLSRDHTRGEFASRDGRAQPWGARALTQNFIFGSRGLGDDDSLRIDPGVDTGTLKLKVGDRLLLTTDGVHGFLDRDRIQAGLGSDSARSAARWLVEEAMAAGSDDNVTALVVAVDALPRTGPSGPNYALWEDAVTQSNE